jgi:hypothetical protein
MVAGGKPFKVDTSPTKEVVVSSLTRDASVDACIFDLIDNAIDAARNATFHINHADDSHILLESYAGYTIKLNISGSELSIEDDCGGIPVSRLSESVLRFGQPSEQHMGIGVFGVGLNRALFKIGKVSTIDTDTGAQRAIVELNSDKYLERQTDWNLDGSELPSRGNHGTTITIKELTSEISQDFADPERQKSLRAEVGRRYGRFIAKGLVLKVNGVAAESHAIPYRVGGPFDDEYKIYKAKNGVSVHIRYGEHQAHRFKKEGDYSAATNAALTSEYGWTVYCNDRAILISNTEWATGWDNFHTEFYGFIGEVSFVGADPGSLPWNTTKTDVDLNNPTYRQALDDMRRFNAKWRSFADQRKRDPAPKLTPIPPPTPTPTPKSPASPPRLAGNPPPKKPAPAPRKPDHNSTQEILPADLSEGLCQDKLLALVHEGKDFNLLQFSYSGLGLMRMLVEVSTRFFAQRHGFADELQTFAITKREAGLGRKLTADQKRLLTPSFDEVVAFMEAKPELWGTKAGALKVSVGRAKGHQQTMNGALHNTWQTINRSEAFRIRDDLLPLLRHLIEH